MASLAVNGGTPVRTKPFTEWPIFGKSDEDAYKCVKKRCLGTGERWKEK